jgi:hypothetical protein
MIARKLPMSGSVVKERVLEVTKLGKSEFSLSGIKVYLMKSLMNLTIFVMQF